MLSDGERVFILRGPKGRSSELVELEFGTGADAATPISALDLAGAYEYFVP